MSPDRPVLPPGVLDAFMVAIERETFTFAKTMANIPHDYVVESRAVDPAGFDLAVSLINEFGHDERWPRPTSPNSYRYLYVNGHRYWTMPTYRADGLILNRAVVHYLNPFDSVADVYDGRFASPEHAAEDAAMRDALALRRGERVLDVGAGTGLLIDWLPDNDPTLYRGVEPSINMRRRLAAKFPSFADRVIAAPLEDAATGLSDVIVALYGTASYLSPEALASLSDRLAAGGRVFLMFYDVDYEPVSCVGAQPSDHYRGEHWLHVKGGAEAVQSGSYWIVSR